MKPGATAGIQLSFPVRREIGPDLDDQSRADPHIRAERGTPGAIHDTSASDQQAVCVPLAAGHAAGSMSGVAAQPRSCGIVADSLMSTNRFYSVGVAGAKLVLQGTDRGRVAGRRECCEVILQAA